MPTTNYRKNPALNFSVLGAVARDRRANDTKHLSLAVAAIDRMAARIASTAAVACLVVAAALLANPLYVTHSGDGGDVIVSVDRTSPASGAADLSNDIDRADDLPPVARYAAKHAVENGSYTVASDGPPLTLQLLGDEWRYLGSVEQVAVYRTTVTVGENETTLELENRSLDSVESELGLTPPGRLAETDHAKEVSWLRQQSDDVVVVGEFPAQWELRLETAVENGSVTVANGNGADAFAPLGEDVRFVVHDDRFYRVAVGGDPQTTALRLTPERDETVLSETNVSVVESGDLSPETRRVVDDAIAAGGSTQVRRDEVNVEELHRIEGQLLRHEGSYYVLRRGHSDDFSLVPLFRMVLTGAGLVFAAVGLVVGAWARRRDDSSG